MNIFQKLTLINKLNKAYKSAKEYLDRVQGIAPQVREIMNRLEKDINELMVLLPCLLSVREDVSEMFKKLK